MAISTSPLYAYNHYMHIHHIYCTNKEGASPVYSKDLWVKAAAYRAKGKCVVINALNASNSRIEGIDLSTYTFRNCSFYESIITDCTLTHTRFKSCDLHAACFRSNSDMHTITADNNTRGFVPTPPEEGTDFFAYKHVADQYIKLWIPASARRSSATTRKCRSDKAFVVGITDRVDTLVTTSFVPTVYSRGSWVYPDSWDDNRWNESSHGIHFFMTPEEAQEWRAQSDVGHLVYRKLDFSPEIMPDADET
jgi:hypothetical protein